MVDANVANTAREKAKELSKDLKSITQLYNDFAVPSELWEVYFFQKGFCSRGLILVETRCTLFKLFANTFHAPILLSDMP